MVYYWLWFLLVKVNLKTSSSRSVARPHVVKSCHVHLRAVAQVATGGGFLHCDKSVSNIDRSWRLHEASAGEKSVIRRSYIAR